MTPVNDPPVAGPDAYAITTGQILTTTAATGVLANDSDVDGDTLTVTGDDSLLVTINPDGSFTYRSLLPTTEVVNYTISDGNGGDGQRHADDHGDAVADLDHPAVHAADGHVTRPAP